MQSCFRKKKRQEEREERERIRSIERKNRYENRVKAKWIKNAVKKVF